MRGPNTSRRGSPPGVHASGHCMPSGAVDVSDSDAAACCTSGNVAGGIKELNGHARVTAFMRFGAGARHLYTSSLDMKATPGLTWDELSSPYVASLYWTYTTITTVGYGDLTPKATAERLYATFIMIIGTGLFGYILASVSASARADQPFGETVWGNVRGGWS